MDKLLTRWSEKQILVAIIFVAVLLRVAAAFYMGDQVVELPGTHDQISYDALAQSLMAGNGYQFPENWYPFTPAETPTAHWSFLYPPFLAGIYQLFGYHPLIARLIQAIVGGILMSLLVYAIGRRLANRQVALVGAGLTAVYGYFIYYNAALMTETFFIVMMLASLHFALQLKEHPTLPGWIWLGLSLGAATLLRQTMLVIIPVLLVWLWWELRGRVRVWQLAISPVIVALLIVPWTVRNQNVYGQLLPLNSNAGYALYASLHPRLGTDWRNEDIVVPIPDELTGLNEAELNSALTKEAIGFIVDDPGRIFLLTLDKTTEYFKFWPSAKSGLISNINRTFSFGLFLPFMVIGLVMSLAHWRRYLPVYLLFGLHTALHLVSWPAPRYRLTADAMLMPIAALAVLELVSWIVRRRNAGKTYDISEPETGSTLIAEPVRNGRKMKEIKVEMGERA